MAQPSESWEHEHFEALVLNGIAAVQGGNRDAARRLLKRAVQIKTTDPRPWLWLSATTDDPEEQRLYLQYAVAADPSDFNARRGLDLLNDRLKKTTLVPGDAVVEPPPLREPQEALPALGTAEQPAGVIPPAAPDRRWIEDRKRLSCERCGALTFLLPGQRVDRCIVCSSDRLVEAVETGEWIDPQLIGLVKLTEQQAYDQVRRWLSQGWLTPDHLTTPAARFSLRPAYYPFWIFDGTLEVNWRCEVNGGTSRSPRWVPRSGTESFQFKDILVPGLRSLSSQAVANIEPFDLNNVVAFSPELLESWAVLGVDLPLNDASLSARVKVSKDLRDTLYRRVEPGLDKRSLASGGGRWSSLAFKNLLLPLWVGSFTYRRRVYRLLVNGQSGIVGGKKPRDLLKFWMIALGGVLILVILVILSYFLILWFGGG